MIRVSSRLLGFLKCLPSSDACVSPSIFFAVLCSGCSDPCRENVHSPTDAAANNVGDFCADTPATPKNYECADPSQIRDCFGKPFTGTDYENLMGYSRRPQDCRNHISTQQELRAHCYLCEKLSSQLDSDAPCTKE
jgi:hypothetical protein